MINRVILVGRLTRDPELRKTNNGTAVSSFTLAVDNRSKDANGEKTTNFIPCIVWNQQAEIVTRFMHKGSLVGVDGRINQRTYESKEGKKVSVIEIMCDSVQFLERKEEVFSQNNKEDAISGEMNKNSPISNDDDLPF